jgi:hypothetical protein
VSTSDVVPDRPGVPARGIAAPGDRSIWWTRRAVGLHVTIVLVVPAFLALFWWQVQRVRDGNTLSWAYVFEWPFFTGYALYLWWKLLHDQVDQPVATAAARGGPEAADPAAAIGVGAEGVDGADEDTEAELAAYNRYLADLHASGRRKRW